MLIHDVLVPPLSQWSNRLALGAIDLYQATASPMLPSVGVSCRFSPTCSRYAEAVLQRYGIFGGGARAAARILRCGPWTEPGTLDPPPGEASDRATGSRVPASTQVSAVRGEFTRQQSDHQGRSDR